MNASRAWLVLTAALGGCGDSTSAAAPSDARPDSAAEAAETGGDRCVAGDACETDGRTCSGDSRCAGCGLSLYIVHTPACSCYHNVWVCAPADCNESTPGTFSDPACKSPFVRPDAGGDATDGG